MYFNLGFVVCSLKTGFKIKKTLLYNKLAEYSQVVTTIQTLSKMERESEM